MDAERLQLQYWHGLTPPHVVTVQSYAEGGGHPCDRLYLAEVQGDVLVGVAPICFLNLTTFEAELDYIVFRKQIRLWPADYLLVVRGEDIDLGMRRANGNGTGSGR